MRIETLDDLKNLRNCLVQYKGGGYEGCFWEYNFCVFDGDGKFHNVLATGSNGWKTLSDMREEIKQTKAHAVRYPGELGQLDGCWLYSLADEEDGISQRDNTVEVDDFVKHSHPQHVLTVARWLDEHLPELGITLFCDTCGCLVLAENLDSELMQTCCACANADEQT